MSQPERKLGTWPVFVIAVSAMTPLTVVAGALPLGYGSVGEKGIPVAYMLVAAVLGIFAVGLAAMARHVPNSGAFYSYASIGLSRPLGVGTAFVALLAYNAMQIGLYGAFGVAAHNALAIFGVDVSWIVLALIGWAVIAALGRLDIDVNARILTVLVCAEVLIVLLFDLVMVGNPAGGSVTFDTLNPALIASAGGVSLLVAAIAGMVGFEAPLVYAAEARDPRRTVARAIGFTLLVAAVLYGGTAWAMSVVAGPDQIVAIAGQHLDDLFFYLPEPYLWAVVVDLGRIFFATSLFAAMLAFHHTVARYGLTVAREGVLPQALARTRHGVPVAASSAQSALALVVLLIFAAAAWNPTRDLFFFGTVSGGLGVLVLMTIASVAVVRFFGRSHHGETLWRRRIAPWISTVFLWLVLLLTVAFFGELLDTENVAKIWSPTLLFALVLVTGIVWGRRLRRERPEVYAVIGTGRPPLAPGETPPPGLPDSHGGVGKGPSSGTFRFGRRQSSPVTAQPAGSQPATSARPPADTTPTRADDAPSVADDPESRQSSSTADPRLAVPTEVGSRQSGGDVGSRPVVDVTESQRAESGLLADGSGPGRSGGDVEPHPVADITGSRAASGASGPPRRETEARSVAAETEVGPPEGRPESGPVEAERPSVADEADLAQAGEDSGTAQVTDRTATGKPPGTSPTGPASTTRRSAPRKRGTSGARPAPSGEATDAGDTPNDAAPNDATSGGAAPSGAAASDATSGGAAPSGAPASGAAPSGAAPSGATPSGATASGAAGSGATAAEKTGSGTARRTPSPRKRTSTGQSRRPARNTRGAEERPRDEPEGTGTTSDNGTVETGRAAGQRIPRARRAPEDDPAAPSPRRRASGPAGRPQPSQQAPDSDPDIDAGPTGDPR